MTAKYRSCENIVLTTVRHHLVSHSLSRDAVGDNSASESGENLSDNVAYSKSLAVSVACLVKDKLTYNSGDDEQDYVRQISTHDGADNAVDEDSAGLFHLCADDEVDNALKQ